MCVSVCDTLCVTYCTLMQSNACLGVCVVEMTLAALS